LGDDVRVVRGRGEEAVPARRDGDAASSGLQIGQLCRKRLWRQNVGTFSRI
jgi:hypothetical protein